MFCDVFISQIYGLSIIVHQRTKQSLRDPSEEPLD